ncbi:MAG: restriction endonuclease subunit S [Lentisphaerae bacterium]|nr:restriction endonuclease subunit S [Lentisphaerota bacterium]
MKKGWQIKRLGEVCILDKVQDAHVDLPYVGLEHIESNTGRFLGSLDPVTVKSSTFRFSREHVLYGRLRPYLNKVLLPDFVGHCSTEIFPLKPNHDLQREFLFYWLLRDATVEQIDATSTGARMPRANITTVLGFEFPLPPLPEQRRIVGILDETFEGIATAKANAEKNLQNAREIFESHLNEVFAKKGEGWVERKLEDVAMTFGRGKSKHRPRNEPKLYGGKYPFIQTGDIRNANHFITEHSQTYSEAGLAQSKLWPKGTICITIAANIAETAVLGFDACFPDSVIGVVANPREAEVGFIEYLLQSFKAHIQALGKGSAQANINMSTFENERFPFPPVAEQRQIVEKLDALSAETRRLAAIYSRKLAALEALKKSLLHQAFAGEL